MKLVWMIWAFIKPVFISLGASASKALLELALEYVREAATRSDWSNEQKRAWVAEKIREANITSGNPLADSVVNLVIEMAVSRLKKGDGK